MGKILICGCGRKCEISDGYTHIKCRCGHTLTNNTYDDGWLDWPDCPGIWADTGASGRITASTWTEDNIRDCNKDLGWKFKFMGPIPDPPSNSATDAEIAAAARTYRAAKDYIAISTARGMLFNLIDRK